MYIVKFRKHYHSFMVYLSLIMVHTIQTKSKINKMDEIKAPCYSTKELQETNCL